MKKDESGETKLETTLQSKPRLKRRQSKQPLTLEQKKQKQVQKADRANKTWHVERAKARELKKVSDALEGKGPTVVEEDFLKTVEEAKEADVLFKPNDGPQSSFLAASEQEVLYGGAAGGGKTIALIVDPLRYCSEREFSGLIIRRTNDELREIIYRTQELYPQAYPGAKWSQQKSLWTFPSGAHIWLTYLEQDKDVLRYQGQAFTYIGVDELTQYPTPYAWDFLRSRLRHPTLALYMRATTNPGGPGHIWVKKMFIDPATFGQAFWATDIETGQVLRYPEDHLKSNQPLFQRRFIPAKLTDNPYLYKTGSYEANLLSLPEVQRKQLLEGSWDIAEGAAFPEFNRTQHVVEPYTIPSDWRRFRAADYGYTSPSACLWFAIAPTGELVVYRELYVKGKIAEVFAQMVLQAESGDKVQYGVLDSSTFHHRGDTGPSLAEQMIKQGCYWRPSDRSKGSRVAGKNEIHRRLAINALSSKPNLTIFNTCRNLIAQLPVIPLDKTNTEDIDTHSEDHIYDALRYGCSSRPMAGGTPWSNKNPMLRPMFSPADVIFGY